MDKNSAYNIAFQYVSYLKQNNYDIVKALMFGSYAKGNFNKDSDIDLALIFKKLDDQFNTQVKLFMLTTKYDTRIEPHPFDEKDFNLNNPLAYEIITHGIEIL
ncbi:MAG: nucleotidyltransferase [Ignavibacteria bacterium]|nr:nucleotidyltransferase [Ignavibacteria bacterium]